MLSPIDAQGIRQFVRANKRFVCQRAYMQVYLGCAHYALCKILCAVTLRLGARQEELTKWPTRDVADRQCVVLYSRDRSHSPLSHDASAFPDRCSGLIGERQILFIKYDPVCREGFEN